MSSTIRTPNLSIVLPTDDPFARIDTLALYQPFLEIMSGVIGACAARGAHYIATCGVRTYADQDKLYAVGRSKGTKGHIITKARGGYSPHNFNVAIDWCRDADANWGNAGLKPDYRDESYRILAEESKKAGLEPGFYWDFQDSPHVQLPLKAHGISWQMLRDAYDRGGVRSVFALLDKHGPWGPQSLSHGK